MTEVCFECSDEKALFLLKASRMFDGGYRDFIDLKRVFEQLEERIDYHVKLVQYETNLGTIVDVARHKEAIKATEKAMEIVKEEVG